MVNIRSSWHITEFGQDNLSGKYEVVNPIAIVLSFSFPTLVLDTTNIPPIYDDINTIRIQDPITKQYEYFESSSYNELTNTFTLTKRSSVDVSLQIDSNPGWGIIKDPAPGDIIELWKDGNNNRQGPVRNLSGIMSKANILSGYTPLRIGDQIVYHDGIYSEEANTFSGAFEFVADGLVILDGKNKYQVGLPIATNTGTLLTTPGPIYGASGFIIQCFLDKGIEASNLSLFADPLTKISIDNNLVKNCKTNIFISNYDTLNKAPVIDSNSIFSCETGVSVLDSFNQDGLDINNNTFHNCSVRGVSIDNINNWDSLAWGTLSSIGLFKCFNNIFNECSGISIYFKLDLWDVGNPDYNLIFLTNPTTEISYFVGQHINRSALTSGEAGGGYFNNDIVAVVVNGQPGFNPTITGTFIGVSFPANTCPFSCITDYFIHATTDSIEINSNNLDPQLQDPNNNIVTIPLGQIATVKQGINKTTIGSQREATFVTALDSSIIQTPENMALYNSLQSQGVINSNPPDWGYIEPPNSLRYNPSNKRIELMLPTRVGKLVTGIIDLGQIRQVGQVILSSFQKPPFGVLDNIDAIKATGSIIVSDGSSITDGDLFELSDGVSLYRFEYNSVAGITNGNIQIVFVGTESASDIALLTQSAINNSNILINSSIDIYDPTKIVLVQDIPGIAGNFDILSSKIGLGSFIFNGLVGGTGIVPNPRKIRARTSKLRSDLENNGSTGASWVELSPNKDNINMIGRFVQVELTFISQDL